jgi:hypothetical protein
MPRNAPAKNFNTSSNSAMRSATIAIAAGLAMLAWQANDRAAHQRKRSEGPDHALVGG